MRLHHDIREKKLFIFLLFFCLLNSIFIHAIASSSHEKVNFSKVSHRPKFKEIYGPVRLKEEIDGLSLSEKLPKNIREFTEYLKIAVPECLTRTRKGLRLTASTYLNIESPEMADKVFKLLEVLYPGNIACDTETILLTSFAMSRPISIKNLFHFLGERAKVLISYEKTRETKLPENHPFHKAYQKLLKKFGNIHYPDSSVMTFEQILPNINDKAIICVNRYVSLVERISDEEFVFSAWDDEGVFFSEPMKDKHLMQGFWSEETERLNPITQYIPLTQG